MSIAYAQTMTDELDKLFVQSATTGFFTDNALRAKFVGAHTVIVPDMTLSGLGDYERNSGFTDGSVNVGSQSFTLTQDRGRSFMLDAQDEDETGIANLAGQVLGEFVRTKVVPEVDAYCLSKLSGIATTASQTVTLGTGETITANVFALLRRMISKVRDAVGYEEELVAFLDPTVYDALMSTAEIGRYIRIDEFRKGDIHTQVKYIDDVAILPVPAARMKSAYTFYDGIDHSSETGGTDESAGGFTPTVSAVNIGAIVCPKKAASLIRKTEKLRCFTPDQNQKADAYKFDYRLYYDLLVKKNQKTGIYTYTYSA